MGNILAFSGLVIGFSGALFIILSKASVLSETCPEELRKNSRTLKAVKKFFLSITEKARKFSFYSFLHKVLLKIKILALKIEKAADFLLKKVRQKSVKKKNKDKPE